LLSHASLTSKVIFGTLGAQVSLHLPSTVVAEADIEPITVVFKIGKSAFPPAFGGVVLCGAVRRALVLAPAADCVKAAAVRAKILLRSAISGCRPTQIERRAVFRIARVLSRVPPSAELVHLPANAQVDGAPAGLRVEHRASGTVGVALDEISTIHWNAVVKLAAAFRVRKQSSGGAPEFSKVRVGSGALLHRGRASQAARIKGRAAWTLVAAPGAVRVAQPEGVAILRVGDRPDVGTLKIPEALVAACPFRFDAPVVGGAEVTAAGTVERHVRQVSQTNVENGAVGRVGKAARVGAGGRGRRVLVPGFVGGLLGRRRVLFRSGVGGGGLVGAAGGGVERVGALLGADVGTRRVAVEPRGALVAVAGEQAPGEGALGRADDFLVWCADQFWRRRVVLLR